MAVVKSSSILIWLCLVTTAFAETKIRVFGDRFRHPVDAGEWMRTYVDMPKDHDGDTVPIAVGLQITPGFLRSADDLPKSWNFTVNLEDEKTFDVEGAGNATVPADFTFEMVAFHEFQPIQFPQVGRNPFHFINFIYNFNGHPPVGVYDYQHFDVRFFLEDSKWWFGEQYKGVNTIGAEIYANSDVCGSDDAVAAFVRATQPVPLDCWPGDPLSTISIGHYGWGQGVHLYDMLEAGFQAWAAGSSTGEVDSLAWGQQDGRIVYMEAMFSRTKGLENGLDECVDISHVIPKYTTTARVMPKTKCLIAGATAFKVEFRDFVEVPGGCDDMRDGPMVGWFPPDVAKSVLGPACVPPVPPS